MLLEFLTDVVSNMDAFKDDINMVYVFHEKDKIIATGNHPKMLLLYRVVPNNDLSELFEAPAYLGALGYLRSLLGSQFMKDGTGNVKIEYTEKNGNRYVNAMLFKSGRVDASFECTNPEILNEKERRTQFDKFKDALIFPVPKEMRKEFDEAARMGTPKADARMFTLCWDGLYIRAIFGQGKHTTSLILTDQVSGDKEKKFQKLISLDRFRPMLRLASENTGQASFHERAFWVDFQTEHSVHTIVTPTLREQAR
jgi:hypothetical protein